MSNGAIPNSHETVARSVVAAVLMIASNAIAGQDSRPLKSLIDDAHQRVYLLVRDGVDIRELTGGRNLAHVDLPGAASPTRAATSTKFRSSAATIFNPIADSAGKSIRNSSASAELFSRDNCEPRSNNGRGKFYRLRRRDA
jgi:hypothetical protein